ncbi:hypothetical protein [Microvirga splendida]|uniref:Uncharacterized protein n=1 Tax=Microvirga splendida TaxID=2795727 RepID=A0ABS0Y934_9HYPH|nr:hypothetical protein [Microvirga splendida]MBJ6128448.1 hypothetical protein [Microvirga splendida]
MFNGRWNERMAANWKQGCDRSVNDQQVPGSHRDPQTTILGIPRQQLVKSAELTKLLFKELLTMRSRRFDDEARIVMAIYAGQVLVFALGALYAL